MMRPALEPQDLGCSRPPPALLRLRALGVRRRTAERAPAQIAPVRERNAAAPPLARGLIFATPALPPFVEARFAFLAHQLRSAARPALRPARNRGRRDSLRRCSRSPPRRPRARAATA